MADAENGLDTTMTPLPGLPKIDEEVGPLVGRTVSGYSIASYLGEGPTGVVYRADDLVASRMAMKVVHPDLSYGNAHERLVGDWQKLASVESPYFVKLYDHGFTDEGGARQFYFTTDLLAGSDLETGLADAGRLTPRKAVEILRQVCSGLEAAHAVGVIHGCLKPRNLFIVPGEATPIIKLLDFGTHHLAAGSSVVMGNPFYLAPEQILHEAQIDQRVDVYALGVLMVQLFTGQLPYDGDVRTPTLGLDPAFTLPQGIDDQLGQIIARAIARKREDRFPTVTALRASIEHWAESHPSLLDGAVVTVAPQRMQSLSSGGGTVVVSRASLLEQQFQVPPTVATAATAATVATVATVAAPQLQRQTQPAKSARKSTNPLLDDINTSDSIESSLEDFISQANASFPAPAEKPALEEFAAAESVLEVVDQNERAPRAAPLPLSMRPPVADTVEMPSPMAAAPSREPSRRAPLPIWGLVVGIVGALLAGAGLMFVMVKVFLPTQPAVVEAVPASAVRGTPAPAQAQAPAVQPVVTSLAKPAAAPETAKPAEAKPAQTEKPAAEPAKPSAIEAQPPLAATAAPTAPAKKHHEAKPAKPKAKTKKSSDDWVNPFGQ